MSANDRAGVAGRVDPAAPNAESRYRRRSFWLDQIDEPLTPRPALPGGLDVDVAIVGAGFTGLWTAYYLAKADPALRIAVLEKEIAGFGASGRNGGWISPFFPAPLERIAEERGRDAAVAMQRAMFATVDEIGRVCAAEGIEARYHKGGVLELATGPEQLARLREEPDYYRGWGIGEDEMMWLDAAEMRARIKVAGCLGALYLDRTARASIRPASCAAWRTSSKASASSIYEQTPVLRIDARAAVTEAGRGARAAWSCARTEGFTPELPGARRDVHARRTR